MTNATLADIVDFWSNSNRVIAYATIETDTLALYVPEGIDLTQFPAEMGGIKLQVQPVRRGLAS